MLTVLKTLLGFGNGAGLVNTVSGIANHTVAAGLVTWVLSNPNEIINLPVTRLDLLVLVGLAWFILELQRRSHP